MAEYIEKSTLVDVIKKRIKHNHERACIDKSPCMAGREEEDKDILSLLDALEIKEDDLFIEEKTERKLAEAYISIFDKKFGNKLLKLKGKRLAEFKNLINTCEQTFCMKYFDYHATQGKLFERLALLWAVWGKEHLSTEVKDVNSNTEVYKVRQ